MYLIFAHVSMSSGPWPIHLASTLDASMQFLKDIYGDFSPNDTGIYRLPRDQRITRLLPTHSHYILDHLYYEEITFFIIKAEADGTFVNELDRVIAQLS